MNPSFLHSEPTPDYYDQVQDLRDKLLKAGLASKKEARKARTEARQAHKEQGSIRADARREQQRQADFAQKQAQMAESARKRQEQLNSEKAQRERQERIQNLIQAHAMRKFLGQDRPFYFVHRDRKIRRFLTTFPIATALDTGQLAIVELRDDPAHDFTLVDSPTAVRLEELEAADWILFWNRPGTQDDLPTYGAQ